MGNKVSGHQIDEVEDDEDGEELQELSLYKFPIENIVFEGGGTKGLAYVGAVQVLHKIGVLKGIKRFAGVSAGAVVAALLAIGYTDISMLTKDIDVFSLVSDDSCLSFLPSIINHFGWHRALAFDNAANELIEAKTGDAAITFKQLYDKSKVELCILAVNINYGILEYCHPKTTPDLQIREAMHMAVSIPGYVRPFKKQIDNEVCFYVDAGFVCNLPTNAFDGWWLSMDPENSFIRRLNPMAKVPEISETSKRFETRNMKTMAFQVYSDEEDDNLRYFLDRRPGISDIPYPDTSLSRSYLDEYREMRIQKQKLIEKHDKFASAFEKLYKALDETGFIHEGKIKDTELQAILSDERNLTKEDLTLLFNTEDTDVIVSHLDRDGDGQIIHSEFIRGVEELGCRILYKYAGYKYISTNNWRAHLNALFRTQQYYLKQSSVQAEDIDRVVGINTGYITTVSTKLTEEDKKYVSKKGRMATIAFLKHLVKEQVATKQE